MPHNGRLMMDIYQSQVLTLSTSSADELKM